jgi:PAS domain S-box-containing protein
MSHESVPAVDRRMALRVLLVEDSEDDALLLLRALRQGGYEIAARRVTTRTDLDAALAEQTWDIAFCDYVMPRLSGPDGIAVIRAQQPDLPVIMVSGEVGEEYAVAAMKAGANDFVMKSRLSRLVPAVARELHEAETRVARQRAEAALRETQERYQRLVQQLPVGIVVTDASGQVISANPAALTILGSPSEEATCQFNVLTLPSLRATGISAAYERVLQGGPAEQLQDWYTSVWGKRSMVRFEVTPLRDAAGGVHGAITIIQDITERVQAVAARQRSEGQLRELIDSVEGVVWEADADTFVFRFVSSQAEKMLGYPVQRWLNEPGFWADHVHPEDRERTVEVCRSATAALQDHTFECRMCAADGRVVWVRDIVTVIAEEGRPVRLRGILLDVTAQRDASAALRRSQDELQTLNRELERRVAERTAQLEAANRELHAFGYSVSHDLIAPLRAVDGYVHMVLEDEAGVISEASRTRLERVIAAAGRMGTLIDRLLELSRVTRAEVHRRQVDLSALARTIAAELQHAEPTRAVEVSIAPDVVADADPLLVRVVLENVFRNAWKYTSRRDRARISFQCIAEQPPVYVVRDNGAGFDMGEAERLFVPFQRLHEAEEFDGAGIGLATTLRVIERHGGRIWAEGAVGQGAAFYFTLRDS